jgi:ATP-binding cassette, subfamily C, bacterial CydC
VRRYPLISAWRLLTWRPLAVLAAGIAIAVVGDGSAIALLGLSGWFLASCYLSGLSVASTFSYLAPSGGVRALALSRTSASYLQRLVSHDATLRWLTRIRLRLFDDVAAGPAWSGLRDGALRDGALRDGDLLDRAIADADTLSETLILTVQRTVVAGIGVAASCVVTGLLYPPLGVVLAAGAAATIVAVSRRRPGSADRRGDARAALITAVQAWPELMSLGAASQLRRDVTARLAGLEAVTGRQDARRSRTQTGTDVIAGLTLAGLGAAILAGRPGFGVPTVALILLLAMGVLDMLGGLPEIARAGAAGAEAARRLAIAPAGPVAPASPAAGVHLDQVRVRDLPPVTVTVPAGGVLIVSGRSGTGKTSLLRAINGELAPLSGTVSAARPLVFVEHDDYIFSGTVLGNLRLADPAITEPEAARLLRLTCLAGAGITTGTRVGDLAGTRVGDTAGARALSGGERRRLVLARAIAARPATLLLDEPTEGLDAATAGTVLANLRRELPASTLIIAMHDKHAALLPETFADRLTLDAPAPANVAGP